MALDYRTSLVTGASSGIGRQLTLSLARAGVTVYAAARRRAQLDALREEAGDKVIPLVLDVADADAAHERLARLDEEAGGLDLVVANAGVGDESYGKRLDWQRVRRLLEVNVMGATATLSAALPGMVKRGRGHLVGISSLAGLVPLPRMAAYCASKAYLAMFLDALRLDVEKLGIAVTSVHPGFVKSEMTAVNKFPMPFLLETDDAADRIVKAIARKEKTFTFPWQMSTAIGTAKVLPGPLRTAVLKRLH